MSAVQSQLNPMPRINDDAPDFEAKTTQGMLRLSDLRGKWVVLFSHPADFTPVCTTEFIEFARRTDDFVARNVQLIGLSIDSVFSHLAWVRNIEQNFNVQVKFPVIADLDMKVASKFGLIHPNASETATVRAVFVIDEKGKVRAVIYYPMSCGRNMDEVLRVIDALQTADKHGVATPANWCPGNDVIVPPPQTQEDAEKRLKSDYEITDWYFAKRKL
ncbi:MAG TPA: peroxiredoxin [Acidobacteriota bacterium]|nr:peroxiredoxin [Acidobacteriota bacterium]HMZ81558.1 peroxiredoxin [Acidobacteriota bacterium]HNB73186.1 peroxiredoxin [Acidobacteriota bacterium]HND18315.1 peroxiredoxin [Acidobacteriota bacterium]HNG91175.1 peroxiredoxin [Acidobacteriota bacterium]